MREQLAGTELIVRAVIGMNELSIQSGYVFCIVVSDLERQQPF